MLNKSVNCIHNNQASNNNDENQILLDAELTKDSDDPCDGYNGDIYDNGGREAACKSHISCTLSSHYPVAAIILAFFNQG